MAAKGLGLSVAERPSAGVAGNVLIDTDVAHAFDCAGQMTAIGWIEGESRLAAQLRHDDWLPGGV
jgi:hypothetical protein